MGTSHSVISVKRRPEIPFFTVGFGPTEVTVLNADEKVMDIFRSHLKQHCTGIDTEVKHGPLSIFKWNNSARFRLNIPDPLEFCNNGAYTPSKLDDYHLINCLCLILKRISEAGYIKVFACNMSWWSDRDVWYFHKSRRSAAELVDFCAVDLYRDDKLNIFQLSPEVNQELSRAVQQNWNKGVQAAGPSYESYKLKLIGTPWAKKPWS